MQETAPRPSGWVYVDVRGRDEVGELGHAFNFLAQRIVNIQMYFRFNRN